MSKPTAILSPFQHRGGQHIKVDIANDENAITLIRQVAGRKWSKTHGCWYVPYTPAVYRQLQELFDVQVPPEFSKPSSVVPPPEPAPIAPDAPATEGAVFIRLEKESENRMKAFVPWQQKSWIEKIKTIPGRAWNQEGKYWSLPMVKTVMGSLKEMFGNQAAFEFEIPKEIPYSHQPRKWASPLPEEKPSAPKAPDKPVKPEESGQQNAEFPQPSRERAILPLPDAERPTFQTIKIKEADARVVTGQKIIVEQWDEHWLCAYVPYDKKGWLEQIKEVPGRKWNSVEKAWLLPNVKNSIEILRHYFGGYLSLHFDFDLADLPDELHLPKKIKTPKTIPLDPVQRLALSKYEEKLILKRYSPHTLKSYKNHFTKFMAAFPGKKPSTINKKEIEEYLTKRITEEQIAENTQNQIINAIKFFYEQVIGRPKEYYEITRPKTPKKLPFSLSEEEVVALVEAHGNLKHTFMLSLIYATGIRLSEVVNLRVRDLHIDRRSIFIKSGKGKKDRYVSLAEDLVPMWEEYRKQYKPDYWLFEGQDGGQYSKRSVQNVLKSAVRKSGVNPDTTVHTLRHTFATHCVDEGYDLSLIQEALGHESEETTRRYVHISNRALKKLASPFDKLKRKK